MGRKWALTAAALLGLAVQGILPAGAEARVSVGVNLGFPVVPYAPAPVYAVPQPESMVFVPESGVYFAPRLSVDLFFSDGYWWSGRNGHWCRARDHRGPWYAVERRGVPRAVLALPPDYRRVYRHGREVPYGQWRRHHDRDEREGRGEREWEEHGRGRYRR